MTYGALPTSLNVAGVELDIRSDYRDILHIIAAFNAEELSEQEKVYVCLMQMYVDPSKIPNGQHTAAFRAALEFIECGPINDEESARKKPTLIDWDKDEQLIFSAINKTAGFEVRGASYLHWWTFLGYFQNVSADDVWGTVLSIRQKRAKHKKLEKWEQEFFSSNRDMCTVGKLKTTKQLREASFSALDAFYYELVAENNSASQ